MRQTDNSVEDTIREDIVAKNSILSQKIFQRSIVENKEKTVAKNYEDKSAKICRDKFNFVSKLYQK